MPIDSLPAEITFAIGAFLDPSSSFSFALTDKRNWSLCYPIITRHKRLFAENRTIDARDSEYPYKNHILWNKLREVLDDNIIGEYVRDISLPSQRPTYLDGDVGHDFQLGTQPTRPPREDLDRYATAKQEMEAMWDHEPSTLDGTFLDLAWDDWIMKGSSEPIIVMLIHYMPYLRTFRFTDLEMEHVFIRVLQLIAKSYGNPSLAPRLPFQHLTTVAVAHWDTELSCTDEWYWFFCAIPSVRNFVANAMSGDRMVAPHEDLPSSNVTELVFHLSVFSSSAFESIVTNTPKLERLSYEIGDSLVSYDSVTPKEDLGALVDHVGHSLQHLTYEFRDPENGVSAPRLLDAVSLPIMSQYEDAEEKTTNISLRGFQQLKTLRIDWRLLQPVDDELVFDDEEKSDGGFYEGDEDSVDRNKDFDVRSVLPASLEKLYLTGPISSEEKEALEKLQHSESEFTPLLKNIYVRASLGFDDTGILEEEEEGIPSIHKNPLMRFLEGQGYVPICNSCLSMLMLRQERLRARLFVFIALYLLYDQSQKSRCLPSHEGAVSIKTPSVLNQRSL